MTRSESTLARAFKSTVLVIAAPLIAAIGNDALCPQRYDVGVAWLMLVARGLPHVS